MRGSSSLVNSAVMASTQVPFLYQTRTLSSRRSIQLSRMLLIARNNRRSFQSCHNLAATGARKDISSVNSRKEYLPNIPLASPSNPFERTLDPPEWSRGRDRGNMVIRKVISDKIASGSADKATTTLDSNIPFEEEDVDDIDFLSASDPFLTDQDIFEERYEEPYGLPRRAEERVGTKSTITVQERDAFRKIFADIEAYSRTDRKPSTMNLINQPESFTSRPTSRTEREKKKKAEDEAFAILGKSVRQNDLAYSLKTQEKLLEDVEQYPQPLRAAAAKALGLVTNKNFEYPMEEDGDQLEAIRQPELERVETLMRSASTDIELWEVLESEVFSLPGKLGLVDEVPGKRSRKKKSDPNLEAETRSLNLSVHGPLYPSHLLLGLRLLDRSFAKPSPLVLNILPRIKSLGLISHALGASTALYNELLRISWVRYDNFRGVLDLLTEMEHGGLEFDTETSSIVDHISSMQAGIQEGSKGRVMQALWSMPAFAPGRFQPWSEKIATLLEAQEMAAGATQRT